RRRLPDQADAGLRPVSRDSAGYFDRPLDLGNEVRQEMVTQLGAMGSAVESSQHAVTAGQYEIDLAGQDALKAADQLVTLKYTLKAVAHRHGLHATFMPKPIYGQAGSGMHTHQTLNEHGGESNAFYDRNDEYHLSASARQFIAGQLLHARALCALVAHLVTSCRRLVPGSE